ncbi:phage tail protein [Aliarcobacter butzleri]|uniref:phage tail-collar fiber domain-containing protein n=1 Tax=Aliarcobacter butzleri TaxID=28197 RepID=UPI001EDA32F2|nr:phage tail protein [Aliarcobacter butzleri]MCG3675580.1 phage tail protein [Aliarcobacter butzleri]
MNNYYSILTNAGIQKEILSKQNGSSINLAKMAVGSGEITPTQTMTSLKSEKYRFNINSILQSETNPNHLIVEGVIPSNVGGFEISEIGIYLDDNTFYAVGNLPKTYKPLLDEGSAKDLTIKMFIEVSNADNIVLKVDDSVVLATRNFVKNELKKYALLNGDTVQTFKVKDAIAQDEAVNKKQVENYLKANCPSGMISIFATNYVPGGFLECNGAAISRTVYAELFSRVETTYGAGDGTNTFNIPDLRDRFVRGKSSTRYMGLKEEDAIRNIWGLFSVSYNFLSPFALPIATDGVFGSHENGESNELPVTPGSIGTKSVEFNASKVVPTADENRPKSITLMFCIKY